MLRMNRMIVGVSVLCYGLRRFLLHCAEPDEVKR